MSILSLHDGEEPENDTIPHITRSHFLYLGRRGGGGGGGGGQVLRLSKQDTAQKQVCVRPGIEGTHPPLTFGIMSGMNFCPPKPGSMVITRTMSTRETKGTTSSTGIPGLMPIPTWGRGGGKGEGRRGAEGIREEREGKGRGKGGEER